MLESTSPLTNTSPFSLPEIRNRVGRFVSLSDTISCARVSKDWNKDFTPVVWYNIDFEINGTFEQLDTTVTVKLGHHIRTVKNLSTLKQLNVLLHPNISRVQVISMICPPTARFRILSSDFINNNSKSLKYLTLKMINYDPNESSPWNDIVKPSLPRLIFLPTHRDRALGYLYQSILICIHTLIQWSMYSSQETPYISIEYLLTETRLCSPKIKNIITWTTPRSLLCNLVSRVFRNLVSIVFAYEQLSMDIMLALQFHATTLSRVSTTWKNQHLDIERDECPIETDHFQSSGLALQLLPRTCPKLKTFRFQRHEMDMDIVEENEWVCKELCHLRVRVRGLDSKEKIDRTLQLWQNGGSKGGASSNEAMDQNMDMSIEARVARHLLTFERLKEVWLGTRTAYRK